MESVLRQMAGKKIEVSTGITTAFKGEIIEVKDGVLHLKNEDEKTVYISIEKIAAINECSDAQSRPGFIS